MLQEHRKYCWRPGKGEALGCPELGPEWWDLDRWAEGRTLKVGRTV